MAAKKNYTTAQLFGLGRGAGLSPEETKAMAYSIIGKDSLRKFTAREINEVCYELMARIDGRRRRPDRATDRQLHKLAELEKALGWAGEPERIQEFLSKYYHVLSPAWLTPEQAAKAIESLKAMVRKAPKEVI